MKKRSLYIILSFTIMLIMSVNLVISTLHSHQHFEWNHPDDFAKTGQCLSVDSTVCPISARLITANVVEPPDIKQHFDPVELIVIPRNEFLHVNSYLPVLGRSPPFPVSDTTLL